MPGIPTISLTHPTNTTSSSAVVATSATTTAAAAAYSLASGSSGYSSSSGSSSSSSGGDRHWRTLSGERTRTTTMTTTSGAGGTVTLASPLRRINQRLLPRTDQCEQGAPRAVGVHGVGAAGTGVDAIDASAAATTAPSSFSSSSSGFATVSSSSPTLLARCSSLSPARLSLRRRIPSLASSPSVATSAVTVVGSFHSALPEDASTSVDAGTAAGMADQHKQEEDVGSRAHGTTTHMHTHTHTTTADVVAASSAGVLVVGSSRSISPAADAGGRGGVAGATAPRADDNKVNVRHSHYPTPSSTTTPTATATTSTVAILNPPSTATTCSSAANTLINVHSGLTTPPPEEDAVVVGEEASSPSLSSSSSAGSSLVAAQPILQHTVPLRRSSRRNTASAIRRRNTAAAAANIVVTIDPPPPPPVPPPTRISTPPPSPKPYNNHLARQRKQKQQMAPNSKAMSDMQAAWVARGGCARPPLASCQKTAIPGSCFCQFHSCIGLNSDMNMCRGLVENPLKSRYCSTGVHPEASQGLEYLHEFQRTWADNIERSASEAAEQRDLTLDWFDKRFGEALSMRLPTLPQASTLGSSTSLASPSTDDTPRRPRLDLANGGRRASEPEWGSTSVDKWWQGTWSYHVSLPGELQQWVNDYESSQTSSRYASSSYTGRSGPPTVASGHSASGRDGRSGSFHSSASASAGLRSPPAHRPHALALSSRAESFLHFRGATA